tara:strand:+ start:111 stop:299 length:189 start_codon:yes stop_codon:yes gene_type:complete
MDEVDQDWSVIACSMPQPDSSPSGEGIAASQAIQQNPAHLLFVRRLDEIGVLNGIERIEGYG